MPTKTKATVEETPKNDKEAETKPLFELSRKVLLAAIGAVALAQEEIEDFINRLVERGEIAEKDGRKLMHEVMEKRKKNVEGAEEETNKRVEEILTRLNVPTKKDIDSLSEKIAVLAKKVDELKKTQA